MVSGHSKSVAPWSSGPRVNMISALRNSFTRKRRTVSRAPLAIVPRHIQGSQRGLSYSWGWHRDYLWVDLGFLYVPPCWLHAADQRWWKMLTVYSHGQSNCQEPFHTSLLPPSQAARAASATFPLWEPSRVGGGGSPLFSTLGGWRQGWRGFTSTCVEKMPRSGELAGTCACY